MASQMLHFAPQAISGIRVKLWGDFAIEDAGSRSDRRPRGRKARALLAYLALHPGRQIRRDRLMALLWGDRPDEQARGSLRQALFELREFSHGDQPLLDVGRESVAISSDVLHTDIDGMKALAVAKDFDGLLAALPEPDETLLTNLDGVDRGFDDWLRIERIRQQEELVALIDDAAIGAAASGKTRSGRQLHRRLIEFAGEVPYLPATPTVSPAPPAGHPPAAAPSSGGWAGRKAVLAGLLVVTAAGAAVYAPLSMPRSTAGAADLRQEAYGLYASAKGMVRKRNSELKPAIEMLHRAVAIDPEFAPAWAELAIATGIDADAEKRLEAERYARRALAIDPNLAEAHAALGMIGEFRGPEAIRHLQRAAELDPHDAQIQFWLSNHYAVELQYGKRLAALRRAVAIDPYWPRAVNEAALAAWNMGYHDEALRYVRNLTRLDPAVALDCDYRIDLESGAYASIVRKIAEARQRQDFPAKADIKLGTVLLILGKTGPARLLLRQPPYQWAVASGDTISPTAFQQLEAGSREDWLSSTHYLSVAVQRLLADGRAAEIVALLDGGRGNLAMLSRPGADPSIIIELAPDVATALARVGREADAQAMIARADTLVKKASSQGPVPVQFLVAAARLRAVQGRNAEALSLLRAASERGWIYDPLIARPDIGDIYAFRQLRRSPAFEAIRNAQLDHIERERIAAGTVQI